MGLRFDPIGGGQFKQAVKQIIEAESVPIKSLETRKVREEARLKLFQEFKGKFANVDKALNEFTNFRKFRELKVDLGDGANQMSVTLDKEKAEPGSYNITVDELAERSSVMTNGFSSPDDPVLGIGYITVDSLKGDSLEIFVDEDHANLHAVANLINTQTDAPIRATVIKDAADEDNPWKLVLSAKKDGNGGAVTFPEFYFMDGDEDLYIDNQHEAQNASIKIDNFAIEAESNDIPDFLQGINVHLKQAKPEQPFTLTITEDYQKVSGKVKGLVDQINGILEFINKQNQVDEKSDTRNTFAGDSGLQSIEYRLRNLIHEGLPVGDPQKDDFRVIFLNQMGIEFDKTGTIGFKEEKFTKALEKDFQGIGEALTGAHGFASTIRDTIANYTRSGNGFLSNREANLRTRIKSLDDDISAKTNRLTQRQQNLTDQFSRLEATLGNLQRQQQYLSATMPSGGGGGGLVSQLLGG